MSAANFAFASLLKTDGLGAGVGTGVTIGIGVTEGFGDGVGVTIGVDVDVGSITRTENVAEVAEYASVSATEITITHFPTCSNLTTYKGTIEQIPGELDASR